MSPTVSIVIRAKDEERWIKHCLQGVFSQTFRDFEVILVDNQSKDRTLDKARQFEIANIVTCTDYRPGKALNLGIRAAGGRYIVCLSAHCIPVNEHWLANLVRNLDDPHVAGVYGRQEPMAFSTDADKRDLVLLFGLDRRVQLKDSFFHNANSVIRREVWDEIPFDETLTNIEDRAWAQRVLERGQRIVYEPEASVYHHHGIHHDGNVEHCANVMRVLESVSAPVTYKSLDIDALNIVAVIPVRGEIQYLNERPFLAYTIKRVLESRHIKRVIVATDNPALAKVAQDFGAEAPFLRDPELSKPDVDVLQVLRYSLEQIERLMILPDLVVSLEITFPFRPHGLLDEMITQLVARGLDSVIAARPENKAIWKERDRQIVQLDEGLRPRRFKDPTFIELRGLGCVTRPEFVRAGSLLGQNIGIYEVGNPYSHLEVRSEEDFELARRLLPSWFKTPRGHVAERLRRSGDDRSKRTGLRK
jgi:CMP-N-acetylneuraminic acid synthetase/GT2 family glycosyltransferase